MIRSPDERSDIRDNSNTAPDVATLIRATKTDQSLSQRRDEFRRIVLQHLHVFFPARRRQQRDAIVARHDVHVQ